MPKVKIDKKALKQNDIEIALMDIRDYIKEKPKQVLLPIGIIIAIAVIVFATTRYFTQQNQTAEMQIMNAQNQYRNALASADKSSQIVGLQQALKSFQNIAKDNSMTKVGKNAGVYIGDCYFHLGQFDDAIKSYRDAISRGAPKITAAWAQMSIGYSYLNKSDYKSALAEFDKVPVNYPDSFLVPLAKLEVGNCYEKQNDLAKAKETYDRVVKTYPDSTFKTEAAARLSALGGSVDTTKSG